MQKYELCCVGHITLDKIVTTTNTFYAPGGTSFYFSNALVNLADRDFVLVTALAKSEYKVVEDLRAKGIDVRVMPSEHSVYFENIYGENQDNRTQRVLAKAAPFTVEYLQKTEADIFLLGALLADDFSLDIIKYLATKSQVAVDSQGYLREVRDQDVYPTDWKNKLEAFKHIHYLKANEDEMETLTGYVDIRRGAKQLFDWGIKEVIITLGSMGSIIYDGNTYHIVPAYTPSEVVDATGCGDTYMTGYLYQRAKGASIDRAGRYGAAMATIKIENSGPFSGTHQDIEDRIATAEQILPILD